MYSGLRMVQAFVQTITVNLKDIKPERKCERYAKLVVGCKVEGRLVMNFTRNSRNKENIGTCY